MSQLEKALDMNIVEEQSDLDFDFTIPPEFDVPSNKLIPPPLTPFRSRSFDARRSLGATIPFGCKYKISNP